MSLASDATEMIRERGYPMKLSRRDPASPGGYLTATIFGFPTGSGTDALFGDGSQNMRVVRLEHEGLVEQGFPVPPKKTDRLALLEGTAALEAVDIRSDGPEVAFYVVRVKVNV